jgi:hypothetical protein
MRRRKDDPAAEHRAQGRRFSEKEWRSGSTGHGEKYA